MAGSHWVKIDRALDHIDALDRSIDAWTEEHKPFSVREVDGPYLMPDPDGGLPTYIRNVKRTALVLHVSEPFPPEWSAYIGDALHNLRSALDHLALALNARGYAEAGNDTDTLSEQEALESEFPVFGDVDRRGKTGMGPTLFQSGGRKIRHVSTGVRSIIEQLQPYKRGHAWESDPLWQIHRLDNIDKHRQLLLATVATERLNVNLFSVNTSLEAGLGLGQPLDSGGELAFWVLPPSGQLAPGEEEPKVRYDLNIHFTIAFGKDTPCAGAPVVETLRQFRDYVRRDVASTLSPFV